VGDGPESNGVVGASAASVASFGTVASDAASFDESVASGPPSSAAPPSTAVSTLPLHPLPAHCEGSRMIADTQTPSSQV